MNPIRIGSVCTGYGGLDQAVQEVFGGELSWVADNDLGAARILAHHHPEVPNLGDITAVDWSTVSPIHVGTAGWPCQGVSNLGHKLGMDDPRSGVWANVHHMARVLRPDLLVLENVAAVKNRGLDRVVTDLTGEGYTVHWTFLPASAAGAPHPRVRFVCVAELHGPGEGGFVPFPVPARDGFALLPTPKASDGTNGGPNQRDASGRYYLPGLTVRLNRDWVAEHDGTDYGPAISRWETVLGRSAPAPTALNAKGQPRESPLFVEWVMGVRDGHVTDVPGLDRNAVLRALGNGVIPAQARMGLEHLRPFLSPAWAARSLSGRTS